MTETIESFALMLSKLLKTDRWALIACDGDMGEGKSCFSSQLCKATSEQLEMPFSYEGNMTYQRKELKLWIDGDKDRKKRLPMYSAILADELISMFFKRNWYDANQIDGIELLNKCRDRHLCVVGNIPCFWDLDSAIYPIASFWVHIHERGRAWVFQKDRNPFANDKWHRADNLKRFRKDKTPYKCQGFVCEIVFDDWSPEDKREYYSIRNTKRLNTEGQRQKQEKYGHIKEQRNELIRLAFKLSPELNNKTMHDVIPSLSKEAIRLIRIGER